MQRVRVRTRLCAAEVTTLRALLTVAAEGDLMAAIGERFGVS